MQDIADVEDLCSQGCNSTDNACHAGQGNCAHKHSCSGLRSLSQLPEFPEWLKQYNIAKFAQHQQQECWQQQLQQQQQWPAIGTHCFQGSSWCSGNVLAAPQQMLSPYSLQQLARMLQQHSGRAQLVSGNTGELGGDNKRCCAVAHLKVHCGGCQGALHVTLPVATYMLHPNNRTAYSTSCSLVKCMTDSLQL